MEAFVNQEYGAHMMDLLAEEMGGKGGYVIMMGTLTAASHQQWTEGAIKRQEEKYPDMYQVCDPVEGSSQEAAYSAAKEVIATYPEIGGFIGCDTNDPPGIAMAVEEAGKAGDIAVTGTCLVSQAKDYLNSGTIKTFTFWDPADAGEAMCSLAEKVLKGEAYRFRACTSSGKFSGYQTPSDCRFLPDAGGWLSSEIFNRHSAQCSPQLLYSLYPLLFVYYVNTCSRTYITIIVFIICESCFPGAFENINFSLYKGEVLGITGLLGCGNAELVETLFGIKKATGGSIEIAGKNVGIFGCVDDALNSKIAYVPEDRLTEGLHLNQSIADNAIARILRNYTGHMGLLKMKELRKKQKESLSSMSVAGMVPENPANSLSGGNQQKIVLIKWLASNPDILILNSPTVGVDVGAKSDIHKIIRDLAREKGVAVLVVSSDMYEIMQICNRVLLMKEGKISQEIDIKDTSMDELEELAAAD